jgi:YHS domain-containing protein
MKERRMQPTRRVVLLGASAFAAFALASRSSRAQDRAFSPKRPVALRGHDPISYFTDGRPEKGSPEFSFSFEDAEYNFVSASHRETFKSDPEKYAPQFSGYCAIAMSHGNKVEPDPEAWAITGGKLYVFSTKPSVPKFQQNTTEIVVNASRRWDDLRKTN